MTANERPKVQPMPEDNPMREFGYRWEVIYPDGSGMGGAATKAEAQQLADKWQPKEQRPFMAEDRRDPPKGGPMEFTDKDTLGRGGLGGQ